MKNTLEIEKAFRRGYHHGWLFSRDWEKPEMFDKAIRLWRFGLREKNNKVVPPPGHGCGEVVKGAKRKRTKPRQIPLD